MKSINISIVIKTFIIFISFFHFSYGQISSCEKIEKTGYYNFNYLDRNNIKTKKDKDIFVVYSDRVDNLSYFDPYQQKKAKKQSFLTPYFVINSKNNSYELVVADSSQIGKPKGFFSIFMNRKNHFKDTKGVKYIGWIPRENLLLYNQSYISTTNNRPLKYKVGNHSLKKLSEIKKFIKEDSIFLFKDPLLKIKSEKKIAVNRTIYPYKYNHNGETVLISDNPAIKDTINQVFGWVPSDIISPIGQGKVYKMQDNVDIIVTKNGKDTLRLNSKEVYLGYLYDVDSFIPNVKKDSINTINIPFYVWDHHQNKIINVKGNNILTSEVDRMKKENKVINFHFAFHLSNRNKIKPLINSLQNIWLFLDQNKDIKYSFSAVCIGEDFSYLLPKTKSFDKWLDFIQDVTERKNTLKKYKKLDLKGYIEQSLSDKSLWNKNFETNFFIVTGTNDLNSFEENNILKEMTLKSSVLLFIQLENREDESYQNYILYAKEILARLSSYHNSFIENYIVDNSLVMEHNTLKNIPSENSNLYVYDAPKNSLYNGGIVFPGIYQSINPTSVSTAIDSILVNNSLTSQKLISSLEKYKAKLGVLRSKPSAPIRYLFKMDSLNTHIIQKNSLHEVFYQKAQTDTAFVNFSQKGYELNKEEIIELIDNYRALLPNFVTLDKKNIKLLKKLYKRQIKEINKGFKRKVIRKKNDLSLLFFYKTGFPVYDKRFEEYKICELNRCINFEEFGAFYYQILNKVETLEKLFLDDKLEQIKKDTYFIPEDLLL